jgi:tRNA(Ile)-lysidine synthase
MTDRILEAVAGLLGAHEARGKRLCVGLSGGVDSVVLMDTLDRLRAEFQLVLSAVHVNHQISRHADQWQGFCEAMCEARGIELAVRRVTVVDEGAGIEAAARDLRRQAYAAIDCDFIALAHHLDDQAETFLLQLLRGAGPKGLAGMPAFRQRRSGMAAVMRPLLGIRRDEIEIHARTRGLEWVTDDSNADSRFDRNFLRNEVLPLLQPRFPGFRETLVRASRNLADDLILADDLAALDAGGADAETVPVELLRRLSDARALNLLRHLFARLDLPMPQRSRLEEALRQSRDARADAEMRVDFDGYALRCYRGQVELVDEKPVPAAGWRAQWDGRQVLLLPDGMGSLRPRNTVGAGIALRHFREQDAVVRGRSGGEAMRPAQNGSSRSLRNLLQENAVPPWERARMPLLFFGERLAWVPGIGVAAEFRAGNAESGVEPQWERT